MKILNFNFVHPFKGRARINMPGQPNLSGKLLSLNSQESDFIGIPLEGFKNGKYNITLDWEIDNRFYVYQQEFEINDSPIFVSDTI